MGGTQINQIGQIASWLVEGTQQKVVYTSTVGDPEIGHHPSVTKQARTAK
jgi:hypothetical protein